MIKAPSSLVLHFNRMMKSNNFDLTTLWSILRYSFSTNWHTVKLQVVPNLVTVLKTVTKVALVIVNELMWREFSILFFHHIDENNLKGS